MAPDAESRILHALTQESTRRQAFEDKVLDEFSDVKGEVLRLGGKVESFEIACQLRHRNVDADIANVKAVACKLKDNEETTGQHNIAKLEAELRRRDDDRRKWLFWAVTTAVGLIVSGGGVGVLLVKLFGR